MYAQLDRFGLLAALTACGPEGRATQPAFDAAVLSGTDAPWSAPAGDASSATDAAVTTDASCAPCTVTEPGQFCGLHVGIDPFVTGGVFGGFQSEPGTGASATITVDLSAPINWVSVAILDPDYDGNLVRAYDVNGQIVSEYTVTGDGEAYVLTEEEGGTGGTGIVRVDLIPAPADYVAYDQLQIVPAGCGPVIL